jgi:hypothetical protein
MAIRKKRSSVKHSVTARHAGATAEQTLTALTLKVDSATYGRLSALRAAQRRPKQEILRQALMEYLERVGA